MIVYRMRCLLCEPGSHWNPPEPGGHENLIALQEHLMAETADGGHGVYLAELKAQRCIVLAPGVYEYKLPDGRHWLRANILVADTK